MYLFSRTARLAPGNVEKSMAWAAQITEKVNQITELNVSLWARVFSPAYGTLIWTATVEALAVLEAGQAKMMADSGYLSLVDEGARLGSGDPIDDALLQVVYADPAVADMQAQYATRVQATLAPGHFVRGMELGVEIAQNAGRIMGCPTAFGVATTGSYGSVAFMGSYRSVDQLQQAREALGADADFNQLLDREGSQVFQANGQQITYRRII